MSDAASNREQCGRILVLSHLYIDIRDIIEFDLVDSCLIKILILYFIGSSVINHEFSGSNMLIWYNTIDFSKSVQYYSNSNWIGLVTSFCSTAFESFCLYYYGKTHHVSYNMTFSILEIYLQIQKTSPYFLE